MFNQIVFEIDESIAGMFTYVQLEQVEPLSMDELTRSGDLKPKHMCRSCGRTIQNGEGHMINGYTFHLDVERCIMLAGVSLRSMDLDPLNGFDTGCENV